MSEDNTLMIVSIVLCFLLFFGTIIWMVMTIGDTYDTRQEFCESFDMDYDHSGFAEISCVKIIGNEVTEVHQIIENKNGRYLRK